MMQGQSKSNCPTVEKTFFEIYVDFDDNLDVGRRG
jgi:hypothetical protein